MHARRERSSFSVGPIGHELGRSEPSARQLEPGPSAAAVSKPLPARFRGTVSFIPASLADQMRATTWHQGCPVSLSSLRLLTLRYWGFDGFVHEGPMVVNGSVATDVLSVFRALFRARFPLKQV